MSPTLTSSATLWNRLLKNSLATAQPSPENPLLLHPSPWRRTSRAPLPKIRRTDASFCHARAVGSLTHRCLDTRYSDSKKAHREFVHSTLQSPFRVSTIKADETDIVPTGPSLACEYPRISKASKNQNIPARPRLARIRSRLGSRELPGRLGR